MEHNGHEPSLAPGPPPSAVLAETQGAILKHLVIPAPLSRTRSATRRRPPC